LLNKSFSHDNVSNLPVTYEEMGTTSKFFTVVHRISQIAHSVIRKNHAQKSQYLSLFQVVIHLFTVPTINTTKCYIINIHCQSLRCLPVSLSVGDAY
jgi:hypothetical protein